MDRAVFDSIEREIDDEVRARFPADVIKQAVLLHYGQALASVWDRIASTTWSRGRPASMGIAPDASKRSCNFGSLRRRYSRVSPIRPQSW